MNEHTYRAGIDVGGTFTDIIVIRDDGTWYKRKMLSTPDNYATAMITGVKEILRSDGIDGAEIEAVVHGSTVFTNAIIQGRGAIAGLITTKGFRDTLEIGRFRRPTLYDIFWEKPVPLVKRHHTLEVDERIDYQGQVLKELDTVAVRDRVKKLCELGVGAIAVCLINSYVNPVHEKKIGDIVREQKPDMYISLSCDVLPEIQEYERMSTTAVNAYLMPLADKYLTVLEKELKKLGVNADLLMTQSNGGATTLELARRRPVYCVESGPAAGVLRAASLAAEAGLPKVISFDMGGTTAKVCMMEGGKPRETMEFAVGAGINIASKLFGGGGYAIRVPCVDMVEIGAGGGSIAWIDRRGMLQVGPTSTGAQPGPACYGLGGTEATVTDANVVLGYMNPLAIGAGQIKIDKGNALKTIEDKVAKPLGMDAVTAAYGIHAIANSNMVRAIRAVTSEVGRDPREFALVAFGGAGPIHAAGLAMSLGISRIIVPPAPGLFSALAMGCSDIRLDYTITYLTPAAKADPEAINRIYQDLESRGRSELARAKDSSSEMFFERSLDLRYVGQSSELSLPVPLGHFGSAALAEMQKRFQQEYRAIHDHQFEDESIEIVRARVRATWRRTKIGFSDLAVSKYTRDASKRISKPARWQAYFGPDHGFAEATVLASREDLGDRLMSGPLVISEADASILVPTGSKAALDRLGNVVITVS